MGNQAFYFTREIWVLGTAIEVIKLPSSHTSGALQKNDALCGAVLTSLLGHVMSNPSSDICDQNILRLKICQLA